MTDSEINVAIAESCGYGKNPLTGWWFGPVEDGGEPFPPDYCADLNTMHEAEKIVDREFYASQLLSVIHAVEADYFNKVSWENAYELTTATARQRAEAFLKTIGKWKE